jgi:hypothetical protein
VDIRRERDIEQLRRVAITQEAQIHALVRMLRAKCNGEPIPSHFETG